MRIPTPKFTRSKEPIPTIEIDMWEIQGAYADGKWHDLIHGFVKNWIIKQGFHGKGTLWPVVLPSVNFHHRGNSCFIAACGLPSNFLGSLEIGLTEISDYVRLSDYAIVSRNDGWSPYLHLENNKAWVALDAAEWIDI